MVHRFHFRADRRPVELNGVMELALAKALIRAGALPPKAADDALHIAIAATNGVPFLLTWNCRHLANATMRPSIDAVCAAAGLTPPIICTPEELLEAKP